MNVEYTIFHIYPLVSDTRAVWLQIGGVFLEGIPVCLVYHLIVQLPLITGLLVAESYTACQSSQDDCLCTR